MWREQVCSTMLTPKRWEVMLAFLSLRSPSGVRAKSSLLLLRPLRGSGDSCLTPVAVWT